MVDAQATTILRACRKAVKHAIHFLPTMDRYNLEAYGVSLAELGARKLVVQVRADDTLFPQSPETWLLV